MVTAIFLLLDRPVGSLPSTVINSYYYPSLPMVPNLITLCHGVAKDTARSRYDEDTIWDLDLPVVETLILLSPMLSISFDPSNQVSSQSSSGDDFSAVFGCRTCCAVAYRNTSVSSQTRSSRLARNSSSTPYQSLGRLKLVATADS